MDGGAIDGSWTVRFSEPLYRRLWTHLFPGDGDEHGAVVLAGICETPHGTRLLAREVVPAQDGIDYVEGQHGYRALTARFVAEQAQRCADERLCYLATHNHSGRERVGFSRIDLESHERGYPALLDITGGSAGALVFAQEAVAGDIWHRSGRRFPIDHAVIVGPNLRYLYPRPPEGVPAAHPVFDRHARLFGDLGQDRLRRMKVGVVGAGGGGSLLVQMLARLGVGHLVLIDHDVVELSNIPRIVGATRADVGLPKVRIAERVALRAQPGVRIDAIVGDVVDNETARFLVDVDVLFLATDTMQSRRVVNALIHQYLIPGFQIGAKVRVDPKTQLVDDVFAVSRTLMPYPGGGCLLCNGLIPPTRLAEEALSERERIAQRYVEDSDVHEPSVITLNAIGAAHAANDMLMMVTSLFDPDVDLGYRLLDARTRTALAVGVTADDLCGDCGIDQRSRFARGDRGRLPTRQAKTDAVHVTISCAGV